MRSKALIFSIFIIILGLWIYFSKFNGSKREAKNLTEITRAGENSGPHVPNRAPVSESETEIEKKLHQEASLVARIDTAPEDTEERLQKWAHTLSEKELEQLEHTALDIQKPQDDRFLAVMLMAWSQKAEALENLKDIALAKIDPYLSPNRMGDFERILRMQAVDGMIDLPAQRENIQNTLQAVVAATSDSTIADRANRALWAHKGDANSPQEQDQAALEKLLKKNQKK